MKKIFYPILLFSALFLGSCQDIFETGSSSVIFEEDNQLHSTSDSLYSVLGILSQVTRLGERYVLTGELRGDLMSVTSDAPIAMQDLGDLQLTEENPYCNLTDYYAVINNCNYALTHMDTTLTSYQTRVMVPEWVAIRALRAWTYWQVALLAGEVHWMTEPIMSVQDGMKDYPVLDQEQLAQALIDELKPYIRVRQLDYGTIDSYNSTRFFVPVEMLLGDLYLFLNDYEHAADSYYNVIDRQSLTITSGYMSRWNSITRGDANMAHGDSYMGELLMGLPYSSKPDDYHPLLIRYSYNDVPSIVPSSTYMHQMEECAHYYGETNNNQVQGYFQGDLRAYGTSATGGNYRCAVTRETLNEREGGTYIYKFMRATGSTSSGYDPQNQAIQGQLIFTRMVPIYRTPHVYLRLAEALNRMGRPTLAFATLKYGLNGNTLGDTLRVNADEVTYPYSEFARSQYNGNVGTATRGRGVAIPYDTDSYLIPDLPTMSDSILYVENCILDEMAAETAFEGNRFFDLLRVARHRGEYPAFMADRVSRRFPDPASARQRLLRPEAWYTK